MTALSNNDKWRNTIKSLEGREAAVLEKLNNDNLVQRNIRSTLYYYNKIEATQAYLTNRLQEFRQRAYICALLSDYMLETYDDGWITYKMQPYSMAVLSGHDLAINRLGYLDLPDSPDTAYWNYSCQGLIQNNQDLINIAVQRLEASIKAKSEISLSKAHLFCINGIMNRDKKEIEKGIDLMELPRNKKRIIANELCEAFLSYYALFYAKWAYKNGIEISIKYERIPQVLVELDDTNPLTVPYAFLYDFYKDKDVSVIYKPYPTRKRLFERITSFFK